MGTRPRILIAAARPGYEVLERLFCDAADAVFVFTLDEAIHALDKGGVDCMLCTIHFDDSRMFDVVRYARVRAPQVPCICTRLLDTVLRGALLDGMLIAVESLGARFVDLLELQRTYGEEAGAERFRNLVVMMANAKLAP